MGEKTAPKCQLRLEWIYGYRGHQCRNNLYYTATQEVVYFVAGVGIVYNPRDNKQRFFLGHDDDVISLCIHPEKLLVATGQVGKEPYICIWNSSTCQTVSILKDGHHQGVSALSFDKLGNKLVSVGLDQHAMVNVWDWKRGKIIASVRGHSDRVFDVGFHPFVELCIVSCGVKHIKFWSLSGNSLSVKKGVFGKVGDIQTMLCLAFAADAITYSGTLSGDIYVWRSSNLMRVVSQAHQGSIFTMSSCNEGFVTGSKDGSIRMWDVEFNPVSQISVATSINVEGAIVRSAVWNGDKVLVGTQDGEALEFSLSTPDKPKVITQGHAEGELWALATHPQKPVFATGSDDCTLRLWTTQGNKLISRTSLDHKIRSCSIGANSHVAVGLINGSCLVFNMKDLAQLFEMNDRKEALHEMKYSPDGSYLAVGSNDNFVDIYAVNQRYKNVGKCSGSSSFIKHLDWSEDSKFLQTNSGAGERLFYKMPSGKRITQTDEIRAIRWASWTGVLGPEVNGIWEKYTDSNDINATDANFQDKVIATGDDFGLVKLFRFPSLKKGAKFRKYIGHSAHVTNCRFTSDKQYVVTTGGGDHAVFQWKFYGEGENMNDEDAADPSNAFAESNSEESDSDISDVGELDSDLEAEKQKHYERAIYKEDMRSLKQQMRAGMKPGEKRSAAPDEGLKLEFVHGYRGYDCRNNVFHLQNGEIVYHVAAVAIIYNSSSHKQRFYLEHSDDILCLALHPLRDVVATGQVGRDPSVHVWDAETEKTLSILKGHHSRGVCAVDFSADGKKLASVGLDDNHCIVVWDWRKGDKLATTRGHKDKIFVVKWNPREQNKLVTVGIRHIKFWTQTGGGFTSSRGTFGDVSKLDTMMCVSFGQSRDVCYTGGSTGKVYVWSALTLKKTIEAHKGPCFAMHTLQQGFVTGGKDGVVCLWDEKFETRLKTYTIKKAALIPASRGTLLEDAPAIRAICLGHGHIVVGTKNGEIIRVEKEGEMKVYAQGHKEGEVWGLCCHPSKKVCATVSDDKTLRVWNLSEQHCMISCRDLGKRARCVSFSPDGKALAVGHVDGSCVVVDAETMEDVIDFHHRKQEISDIKFSPDPGKYLAVGSHDNLIDIYNVLGQKRVGVCKGNSSYITHIDWDRNGKLIVTNSGSKEQLFFEAPRGKRHVLRSSEIEKQPWFSWTGVLGSTCEGIWPPGSNITDINAADLSADGRLLATADDFGFVKVFHYPVKGQYAKFKKYVGHSAHVTKVAWTCDDSHLTSIGGADTALMVWTHLSREDRQFSRGDSDDSDTGDEEDGGYDSDVAHEKDIDYTKKAYADPLRKAAGVKPCNQEFDSDDGNEIFSDMLLRLHQNDSTHSSIFAKLLNKSSPTVSRQLKKKSRLQKMLQDGAEGKRKGPSKVQELHLDCIFGFRGFDGRNNLHYINDATEVVYHAAGTGIVLNIETASQTFYFEHTDDILCLAVNAHPKFRNIIATGQVGSPQACVRVWDAVSKRTVSVLKGFHAIGICSVDFSCSGKLLLTVGLDEQHSVAVWRWQDGSLVASSAVSVHRIFQAEFRPDSDNHFVTVGVQHIRFWMIAGSELVAKKGVLTSVAELTAAPKMQTMLSVAFGVNQGTFTGAINGDVYIWKENQLIRIVQKAHNGPVFCLFTTLKDGLIVSGAKEKVTAEGGPVKLWDQEMKRCRAFQLKSAQDVDVVKSVCRSKGKIIVGTKESEFIEINEKTGETQMVTSGHGEGELWGLAPHPSATIVATASDDGTVRLWDFVKKRMLNSLKVGPARSVDISPHGEMIAVGLKNGGFIIVNAQNFKVLGERRDRSTPINAVRFSPDNGLLAVGAAEGIVDFYELRPSLDKKGYCGGINGFVAQMDFATDSKHIRVSNGSYKNQWFTVPKGSEITDNKELKKKLTLSTWTSVFGGDMVGIWPPESDNANVNCAHVSHAGNTVVTGDDDGLVKLYDFPANVKEAEHKTYMGHSAHVTNICFSYNDRFVISAGGDDCCIFVWKCK